MTKIPKRLEEMIEKKAEQHSLKVWPIEEENEGLHVWTEDYPRDFRESCKNHYKSGGTDLTLAVLSEASKLVEALDKIANEDFRGNRPPSSVLAHNTLSNWKKFSGE